MTPEHMLRVFHATAGLTLPARPTLDIGSEFVSDEVRQHMLDSEVDELREAVAARDLVAIADALADIVYVVVGTAVTYGLPFDAVLAEVHRSNMTKFLPDGPVINSDGKIVKGPNYQPPDLEPILTECPPDEITLALREVEAGLRAGLIDSPYAERLLIKVGCTKGAAELHVANICARHIGRAE